MCCRISCIATNRKPRAQAGAHARQAAQHPGPAGRDHAARNPGHLLPSAAEQAITNPIDITVRFRGGVINEFYPDAAASRGARHGAHPGQDARPASSRNGTATCSTTTWSARCNGKACGCTTRWSRRSPERNLARAARGEFGQRVQSGGGRRRAIPLLSRRRASRCAAADENARAARSRSRAPANSPGSTAPATVPNIWLADVRADGVIAFREHAGRHAEARKSAGKELARIKRFSGGDYTDRRGRAAARLAEKGADRPGPVCRRSGGDAEHLEGQLLPESRACACSTSCRASGRTTSCRSSFPCRRASSASSSGASTSTSCSCPAWPESLHPWPCAARPLRTASAAAPEANSWVAAVHSVFTVSKSVFTVSNVALSTSLGSLRDFDQRVDAALNRFDHLRHLGAEVGPLRLRRGHDGFGVGLLACDGVLERLHRGCHRGLRRRLRPVILVGEVALELGDRLLDALELFRRIFLGIRAESPRARIRPGPRPFRRVLSGSRRRPASGWWRQAPRTSSQYASGSPRFWSGLILLGSSEGVWTAAGAPAIRRRRRSRLHCRNRMHQGSPQSC